MAEERETKETEKSDPETLLWAEPQPTTLMERDRLRELIAATADPEPPSLAHTIRRELLRPQQAREALDTDIRPSLSPILVAAVITLLVIAFIAATHVH